MGGDVIKWGEVPQMDGLWCKIGKYHWNGWCGGIPISRTPIWVCLKMMDTLEMEWGYPNFWANPMWSCPYYAFHYGILSSHILTQLPLKLCQKKKAPSVVLKCREEAEAVEQAVLLHDGTQSFTTELTEQEAWQNHLSGSEKVSCTNPK